MSERSPLAPMIDSVVLTRRGGVRSPKTAELVAATLRRMIVLRQLQEGDYLPQEAELMEHFQVSRPTLREAVRVLESEGLVEVRRGSRTGARVRVPGPEAVARPAALLLELAGATLGDVMTARTSIEPLAARLLAESGTIGAKSELRAIVESIPRAWETGSLASASASLHRCLVELSGNATLSMVASMLHEIATRHTAAVLQDERHTMTAAEFDRLLRSYRRLTQLVDASDGEGAAQHWRRHMENSAASLLQGYEKAKVVDLLH
ncbi:GntR family transcriptional regulator [Mycolicibacterium sp. (ex Dasyatis americana)]|nr:GntR family transcriptional regulator [Mycolicibacterium sp. (ex Dasyatis americana)]